MSELSSSEHDRWSMTAGSWNTTYLAEAFHWCFQSTKTERLFILGRHGRGRPKELWNRGPLECDHPKDSSLPVLTLWELNRNLPWQRKQPLLRWTFIKTESGFTHTHTHTPTPIPGSEPCYSSPPWNLDGGILGKWLPRLFIPKMLHRMTKFYEQQTCD